MVTTVKAAPLHSIVMINDPLGGVVPGFVRDALVMATDSCIAVACWPEIDGPTEFTLGTAKDVDPGYPPAYEGKIETPSRRITLETTEGDTLLQIATAQQHSIVRVWTNSPRDPDKVIIGII